MEGQKEHVVSPPLKVEEEKAVGLPRLGEPAPPFEAVTTHGVLKLSDF